MNLYVQMMLLTEKDTVYVLIFLCTLLCLVSIYHQKSLICPNGISRVTHTFIILICNVNKLTVITVKALHVFNLENNGF